MLIFEKKEAPPKVIPSWDQELKDSLIKKCRAFITAKTRPPKIIEKPKLWYNFINHERYEENHNYSLSDHGHGLYSEYVPVKANHYQPNEFSEYFLFLKQLMEKHSSAYELNMFEISNELESCKDYRQWMEICRKYLFDLTIQEMFQYYHLLLLKGLSFLDKIIEARGLVCNKSAFIHRILQIKRFDNEGTHMNSLLAISIDRGQEITLENISKTFKQLFCSICLTYDCQRHCQPANVIKNNFQYIHEYDMRHRLQNRKKSSHKLFQQFLFITGEVENRQTDFCSEHCFKRLDGERWKQLKIERKKRIYSPIFKSLVNMGIQLFNYNPCDIKTIFENTNLSKGMKNNSSESSCEQIFYYFVQEYNLPQRMQFKFYEEETEFLENEPNKDFVSLASAAHKKMIKKSDKTAKKIECEDQYNSICFHYFLGQQPTDITCLSCDCQIRGYCLPSCGCSELCDIKRKGCKCKSESSCWQNKCPCFKNNHLCLPEVCEGCFDCKQSEKGANWCQNNEKYMHRSKLTRIGKSKIQNAGLGLFAGEFIFKGEFVMKYLGEIIESNSLEKIRETLVENNLFYTFKLTKYQSVDSRIYGNKARFINHSKKLANVVPKSMKINQEHVIVFHATKDIQVGEEIYFNYNGQGQLSEFKQKFPFID